MKNSNPIPSLEFLQGIHDTFHPEGSDAFYINHPCFVLDNHIVKIKQIYALLDFEENSISNVIPFRLEDLLIVSDFIMIVGVNMLSGEELARNEYLIDNKGCAFKLVDFNNLRRILNKMDGNLIAFKMD